MTTRCLANFARSGDPNGNGLPQWLPAGARQKRVMMPGDRSMRMGRVNRAKLIRTMLTHPPVGE